MKNILICLCFLTMCSIVLAQENNQTQQQKEEQDYRSVIVDAWLVKVDADTLYQSGVKPLSEKEKENVSIMNLMWCLSEPNCAQIIASAKTQSYVGESAKCELSKLKYVADETITAVGDGRQPIKSRSIKPYSSTTKFENYSRILDNKKIRVEYTIKANDVAMSETRIGPAEEIQIEFFNTMILSDKKFTIVGQSQIGNDMFFLVMRAEIVE